MPPRQSVIIVCLSILNFALHEPVNIVVRRYQDRWNGQKSLPKLFGRRWAHHYNCSVLSAQITHLGFSLPRLVLRCGCSSAPVPLSKYVVSVTLTFASYIIFITLAQSNISGPTAQKTRAIGEKHCGSSILTKSQISTKLEIFSE